MHIQLNSTTAVTTTATTTLGGTNNIFSGQDYVTVFSGRLPFLLLTFTIRAKAVATVEFGRVGGQHICPSWTEETAKHWKQTAKHCLFIVCRLLKFPSFWTHSNTIVTNNYLAQHSSICVKSTIKKAFWKIQVTIYWKLKNVQCCQKKKNP